MIQIRMLWMMTTAVQEPINFCIVLVNSSWVTTVKGSHLFGQAQ